MPVVLVHLQFLIKYCHVLRKILSLYCFQHQLESDRMAAEAILRSENDKLATELKSFESENEQLKLAVEESKKHCISQEHHLQKLANDLQTSVER